MAIVLISQPSATPSAPSDYQAQNTLIGLLAQRGDVVPFFGNNVKKGSVFNIGGAIFSATSDTAITGTATNYVKLTVSGANATASYVALPGDLAWNDTYNGYYSGSDLILFDEEAAVFRGEVATARYTESRYTTAARILERLLTVDSDTSGLNAQYLGGMDKDRFLQLAAGGLCVDISEGDSNDVRRTGIYMGFSVLNAPTAEWTFIEHYGHNNLYNRQIAYSFNAGLDSWFNTYTRAMINGTWTAWAKQWNSYNDGAGSGLDADLLDGKQSALTVTADTIPIRDAAGRLQSVDPAASTDVATKSWTETLVNSEVYSVTGFLHSSSPTNDSVFQAMAAFIPSTNDKMKISGSRAGTAFYSHAVRTGSTTIVLYGTLNNNTLASETITSGSSTPVNGAFSICW